MYNSKNMMYELVVKRSLCIMKKLEFAKTKVIKKIIIGKTACVLMSIFVITSTFSVFPSADSGPFTKDTVISMINALPSTYEGIPLIRPQLSEFNYKLNAVPLVIDETVTYQGLNPVKVMSSVPGGGSEATYVGKVFNQPQNFSSLTNIELILNFYGALPETTLDDLRVDLRTDSDNYFRHYINTSYWYRSPGVARIRVSISDFEQRGAPDLSNINSINLRFGGTSGKYASIGIFSISYNARSTPKVMFTFDDGYQDNYDHAYPILEAEGIKATEYVVSNFVTDIDPKYMRASTLDELYDAGWDIANQTSNYANFGSYTTDPVVMAGFYNECMNYLLGLGFTRSAAFAAYPGGHWSDALIDELENIGILSARSAITGLNPEPVADLFKLRKVNLRKETTFGDNGEYDIKPWIDLAISTGQTLIIRMNRVTPDNELDLPGDSTNFLKTSTTKLNQIVQYIVSKGVDTPTISQWYTQIQNTITLDLSKRADVEAVRAAYDTLIAEDKILVSNYTKLTDAEAKIAQLTADVIDVIKGYAAIDNADGLTINDLSDIGITGADEDNLQSYKTAIANSNSGEVDTLTEIQAIIDAVNEQARFPIITISTYNTEPTNQYITVTATTNKGTLNKSSHTFTENGSFKFVATADATHETTKTVTITNIDRTLTNIESSHPYANNFDNTWVYAANNADSVMVTFSEDTFTEAGMDLIYIMDENDAQISGSPFSGIELAGQSKTVIGNIVKIRLSTDNTFNYYGFRVTDIQTLYTTLPDIPSGLTLDTKTDTSVDISWSTASKARSYNVYNGTTKINTTPIYDEGYQITGLDQLTEYTFTVTATNEIGESLPSTQLVVTTEETPTIPQAPTELTSTGKTHASVDLNWTASLKATSYNLYIGVNKINITPIVSTTYNVTNLLQLTTYDFKVTAVNAVGESLTGAELSVTTNETPKSLAVISKINELPSTYEGIPLLKPELSEISSTDNAASVTIDDTENYQGVHPIKVTSSLIGGGMGGTYITKNFSQSQNLSSLTNIELVLNFYEPIPSDKLDDIRIDLRTDSDNYYYKYVNTTYWQKSPGVARIRYSISEFSLYGNPYLSNINTMRISFSGTDGNYASLGIYSISYNARSIPKVVLTFDDGWQDNYDHAFPILEEYGIKATTYAVSDFVQGSNPDYMRGATLDQLYAAGWDIGNHSSNHAKYGYDVTDPAIMASYFNDCRNYLLGRGYTRSAGFICYPDGKWDDDLAQEVENTGFSSARTTVEGLNAQPFTNLFKLRQMTVGQATTFGVDNSVDDIKASIDKAISSGQTLYVMMHRVAPDNEIGLPGEYTYGLKTPTSMLRNIAQYLVTTGVETCTVSQWYSEIATTRTLKLSDHLEVEAARQSYNELTSEQKDLVLVTNYSKLTDIEAKINQLYTDAIETIKAYAANDNADNLQASDLTDIGALRVVTNNIQAYRLAIANATPSQVDTLAEIQAIVDYQNDLASIPVISIGDYDGATPTNQDITVFATTSEGTLNTSSHTFTENGFFNFVATDAAGNTTTVTVTITNIDKIAPDITIGEYILTPTNQNITVFATTSEGTLNTSSHTFTENGKFDFTATDEAGNITTVTVTITNIDKIAPDITIEEYILTPTNQDITVFATTSEGTLNTSSHTFTENGFFNFVATDAAGNSTTVTVTITNIDKIAPDITIGEYILTPTNQNITVFATTSEGTLNTGSYTFTENGFFNFVATDAAGNITTVTVTITNIDKIAPDITIEEYILTPTNQNITVFATTSEGTLNTGSHTFTENGSFNFVAIDAAGNTTTVTVTITNIDKDAPKITIEEYILTPTNQDITVNATCLDGELNFASHTFTENGFFNFVATDAAGNITTVTVTITNIDKIAPDITIGEYILTPTNQNITVFATTSEGTLNTGSHTFTENGSFDFVATDAAGNSTTVTVTITNIDKMAPDITIEEYILTPTNQDITVFATTSEETLNTGSHTFTENGKFDFTATDEAGNTTTVTVTITNIYPMLPVPELFGFSDRTGSTIHLIWSAVIGATGYNIYIGDIKINSSPISASAYTVNGLTRLTTYEFTVKALNEGGESIHSKMITAETYVSKGDANNDGSIDIIDLTLMKQYLLKITSLDSSSQLALDTNNDGKLTISDLLSMKKHIINIQPIYNSDQVIKGDLNDDGLINISDLTIIKQHIIRINTLNETSKTAGDINTDGYVTISDLLKIKKHILEIQPITATIDFKGSSLGDPSRASAPPEGGNHNLVATYKNNTAEIQKTVLMINVMKNNELISTLSITKDFLPSEEYNFTDQIYIPATSQGDIVEVDFVLVDSLITMKTKHDTVKNSINNVR
jgi:peptidoglycan/xylan/chitin deacetylase (PgdA/CDA1 family)